MNVAILAGCLGTRLSEENRRQAQADGRGGRSTLIWHILKHYEFFGFSDFYIALGIRASS